jgi:CelD/BcsL family acetyltransferase involved in cellulose biosynthesis
MVWSEAQWLCEAAACSDLLARSDANKLFLSWDWQTLWWKHLRPRVRRESVAVHVVYDGPLLVGMMTVIAGPAKRRGMSFRVANIAGAFVRDSRGMLSEYLDVVAARGYEDEVRRLCTASLLGRENPREFGISMTGATDAWTHVLGNLQGSGKGYVRVLDRARSYQVDLSGGFDAYLRRLGASSRRSLFNLRERLSARGDVCFEELQGTEVVPALHEMNHLHRIRWGAPAFTEANLAMHVELTQRWHGSQRIRVSRLSVGGQAVSVLYDIRLGDAQYNIQMGFNPAFEKTLSLGLLHLGYAMERAAAAGVLTYDFLAGSGMRADYKVHLADRHLDLATVQFIPGAALGMLYRCYDRLASGGR